MESSGIQKIQKVFVSIRYSQFNAPLSNIKFFIYTWLSHQDFDLKTIK